MSKIIELVKYQLRIYLKSSRFIMLVVAVVVFLNFMYSLSPAGFVGCFCVTGYFVFMVMAWVGFGISSSENEVMEQIQLLRVQGNTVYYMGKASFLIIIGLLTDFVCIAFPLVKNALVYLFDRPIGGYDILNAAILLAGCSFVGGALGSMLHPRVMRDRKAAALLTLLFAALTVIRASIIREMSFFRFIAWILPPIDKIFSVYGSRNYFSLAQTFSIFIPLALYGMIYSIIKSVVCCARKFN